GIAMQRNSSTPSTRPTPRPRSNITSTAGFAPRRKSSRSTVSRSDRAFRASGSALGDGPTAVLYGRRMLNPVSMDRGENERLQRMFDLAPGFMAMVEGDDHCFVVANRAFHHLVGDRDLVGKAVANALPEFAGQGFVEALDKVALSGEPFVGRAMPLRVAGMDGSPERMFVDLVFQPLFDADGEPSGIFVAGHNVTEDKR